jgi:hypothetical protein
MRRLCLFALLLVAGMPTQADMSIAAEPGVGGRFAVPSHETSSRGDAALAGLYAFTYGRT